MKALAANSFSIMKLVKMNLALVLAASIEEEKKVRNFHRIKID